MRYLITVHAVNSKFEPVFEDGEWCLGNFPGEAKMTPIPDWSIVGVLDMLHKNFDNNFEIHITPVRDN